MNQIVLVAGKPVKLIDALCCEMAKEARRLSGALDHCSANLLAGAVAVAEVIVATPEYEELVGVLQAALAPASVTDIKRELGMLFACYPAKDVDIGALVACALDEVIREQPTILELLVSVRLIRRTCKFRPSIAEIIEALDDAGSAMVKAKKIVALPKRLDEAASGLQRMVKVEMGRINGLLSDRERRLEGGKNVDWIDVKLKNVRGELADVLAHRVTALEPLRPLIAQSITITKDEAVRTPW
jgi:hypothetical protein